MLPKWPGRAVWLLLLGGCCYPVREKADLAVCDLAARPIDLEPASLDEQGLALRPARDGSATGGEGQKPPAMPPPADRERPGLGVTERLKYPSELPGADAVPIKLPELPPLEQRNTPEGRRIMQERRKALERFYPQLPPLGANPQPVPGPAGRPLTLADLQQLALSNSPLVRQATADVEAAWGLAVQAGAYPNPTFGYQSDTAGTGATAGFQGIFFDQMIKTAGKLKLAQAAAIKDYENARLAFRRAQTDLMAAVRTGYFNVLVAQENIRVTQALTHLEDETFKLHVERLTIGGVHPPYEPTLLRSQSYLTRVALITARNSYTAAWKQLAATLGLPAMPPTELAGRVDMPIPVYRYDQVLAWVLSSHTDVRTAQNTLQKARYNLRLAQITPIPDVSLHVAVEKDYSMPPFLITHSIGMGVPVPLWDRNKGNIMQAQGALLRAIDEPHRVRDDLTSRLADAFSRYNTNHIALDLFRETILPDQARAWRSMVERFVRGEPEIGFLDLFVQEQTLATTITTYITTLGAMWTAVSDVANLLQTNDLFQVGDATVEGQCLATDLAQLLGLPCCHPCTPLPDPALKGGNGQWPRPIAGKDEPAMPPAVNGLESSGPQRSGSDSEYEVLPLPRRGDRPLGSERRPQPVPSP